MGIIDPAENKKDLSIKETAEEQQICNHFHIDPAEYSIDSDEKIQIEIEKNRQHKIFVRGDDYGQPKMDESQSKIQMYDAFITEKLGTRSKKDKQ